MDLEKSGVKTHLIFIALLLLISLVYFKDFLNPSTIFWNEHVGSYYPRAFALKDTIKNYGTFFPLWSPYIFSGTPWLAKANTLGVDSILGPLLLFCPNVLLAVKLNYVLDVFLAGLFMYLFMIYLQQDSKNAFISAIIYMLNGWVITHFNWGHLTTLNAYPFIPLIMLFVMKTLNEKDLAKNSILTALVLAVAFRAGPDLKVLMWAVIIAFIYAVFFLIGKNFKKRCVKAAAFLIILFLVFFGLSAQKVLPIKEHLDGSARADLPYDQSATRRIHLGTMFDQLVEPFYGVPQIQRTRPMTPGYKYNIGIIAFLLALSAVVWKFRSKKTLFFLTVVIVSLFLVSGSFLYYLLWKYVPPFSSFRYLPRLLSIYAFAMAALAGIGAGLIAQKLQKHYGGRASMLAYISITVLILLNLAVFGMSPYPTKMWDVNKALEDNHALQYISKQPGIFRIQTWETRGIDWGIEVYTMPLNLEEIYGYDSTWYSEYFNIYLGVANNDPAKFWGILNTKYVTSKELLNITGLRFVKRFDNCTVCFPDTPEMQKAWGPYLYENEMLLPRAYFAEKSMLLVGNKDDVIQSVYAIMLMPEFNPSNTVIIMGSGKKISDYKQDFLNRFDAIFLTRGSVDDNSNLLLRNYVDSGGVLLPNVVEGKNTVSDEEVRSLLKSFNGSYNNIDLIDDSNIITHTPEKKEIMLDNRKGFLVLSEIYHLYPGWSAKADDGKKEILRANGIVSAVYIDSPTKQVVFEYKPRSYQIGVTLTILTILFLIFYFGYSLLRRSKGQEN